MELIKSLIINYKYVPTLNQVHKNMSTNNVQSQLPFSTTSSHSLVY